MQSKGARVHFLIATVSLAGLAGCRLSSAPLSTSVDYLTNRVSLLPLIVYPERYYGKKVVVDGILEKSDGLWRVYLSRELANHKLAANSVALDLSEAEPELIPRLDDRGHPNTLDAFVGNCVAVNGTFRKPGGISNISAIIEHSLQAAPESPGEKPSGNENALSSPDR